MCDRHCLGMQSGYPLVDEFSGCKGLSEIYDGTLEGVVSMVLSLGPIFI